MSYYPPDNTALTRALGDELYAPRGGVLSTGASDSRYVNVTGDNMTGALESSAALAVTVGSTASGAFRAMAGGISALGDIQTTAGRMYVGSGSTGSPGFSFTGNTNTGVNRAAANHVTLNGGGVVCLGARYASAGNLGGYTPGNFGAGLTDYPSVDRFHASWSSAAASMFWGVNGTSGGTARIGLQTNAGSAYHIADNGSAGWHWGLRQSDAAFVIGAGSGVPGASEHLTVTQAGVVTLGTVPCAGTSFTSVASRATNTANAIVASVPTGSVWTIWASKNSVSGEIRLEVSSSLFTMGVTVTSFQLVGALAAEYRPANTFERPFRYYRASQWNNGSIFVQSNGVVYFTGAAGVSWTSGNDYQLRDAIIYRTDSY